MKEFPIDIDKKVRCIKDDPRFRLEKDKIYTAISYTEKTNSYYIILVDGIKRGWVPTDIFIDVKAWRDLIINDFLEL